MLEQASFLRNFLNYGSVIVHGPGASPRYAKSGPKANLVLVIKMDKLATELLHQVFNFCSQNVIHCHSALGNNGLNHYIPSLKFLGRRFKSKENFVGGGGCIHSTVFPILQTQSRFLEFLKNLSKGSRLALEPSCP